MFKTTCQHAQKSGGGDPVNRATNAQRNAGNAQRNQHFAVTVVAVRSIKSKKIVQTSENQPFYLFGTYKGKWLQFWRWQRIINLLLPKVIYGTIQTRMVHQYGGIFPEI